MDFTPMTPEERDRTIEFILNCQARYEAILEQEAEARRHEAGEWKKDRQLIIRALDEMKNAVVQVVDVIEIQSKRLDQHDRWFHKNEKDAERRHQETIACLDRISERLANRKKRQN
jgi:hypothetical protein